MPVGFTWYGLPNRTPYDKALPSCVAWECVNLIPRKGEPVEYTVVRSGFHDPRSFPAAIRKAFRPDGTCTCVHEDWFFVAIPEDMKVPASGEELTRLARLYSSDCLAGWNVAEAMVRVWLLHNLDRVSDKAIARLP